MRSEACLTPIAPYIGIVTSDILNRDLLKLTSILWADALRKREASFKEAQRLRETLHSEGSFPCGLQVFSDRLLEGRVRFQKSW